MLSSLQGVQSQPENAYELVRASLLDCRLFSVATYLKEKALFFLWNAAAHCMLRAAESDTKQHMRQRTEDATEIFRNTPGAAQRARL